MVVARGVGWGNAITYTRARTHARTANTKAKDISRSALEVRWSDGEGGGNHTLAIEENGTRPKPMGSDKLPNRGRVLSGAAWFVGDKCVIG